MAFRKIWHSIKTMFFSERWLIQLDLLEKTVLLIGLGFWWLLVVTIVVGIGFFAGIWAALWIGAMMQDVKIGFISVAAFFFCLLICVWVWRKRIQTLIVNQAIRALQISIPHENLTNTSGTPGSEA